jgi:hypothetical protein
MLEVSVQLVPCTCPACGIVFGMPENFVVGKQRHGGDFFCPAGHAQTYGENENSRLLKQVAQLTSKVDQEAARRREEVGRERASHEKTQHRLRGTKAALTRTKNRVAAGNCPCCDKHFADLAGHMTETHPDYVPAEEAEEKTEE